MTRRIATIISSFCLTLGLGSCVPSLLLDDLAQIQQVAIQNAHDHLQNYIESLE